MRRAVLAGICLKKEKERFAVHMEECVSLCEACGIEVCAQVTQQSNSMDPRTAFRAGKLEELAAAVAATESEAIIFAQELPIAVMNRIQEACGVNVIDRTALILDIFSHRAKSRQAKLQVELARLEYAMPSAAAEEETEEHSRGGGFRNRGGGETRTAGIRRTYRKRITALKKELAEIEKDYQAAEHRRSKSELGRVALIGYTNAGKSSLMNAILACNQKEERQVFVKDMLFATLDSSVRNVSHRGMQFLLYDTVGFVSDLPHTLVEAFHSTLDSARNADLLIHVADLSDPFLEEKIQVTLDTLRTIQAEDIPMLTVFTKADQVKEDDRVHEPAVSSVTGEGIEALLDRITDRLYPREEKLICMVPYAKTALIHDLRRTVHIELLKETENGQLILAEGETARVLPLKQYEVKN